MGSVGGRERPSTATPWRPAPRPRASREPLRPLPAQPTAPCGSSGPSAGTARHLRVESLSSRPADRGDQELGGRPTAGAAHAEQVPSLSLLLRASGPRSLKLQGSESGHTKPGRVTDAPSASSYSCAGQTGGARDRRQGNRASRASHGLRVRAHGTSGDAGRHVPCGPATSTPGPTVTWAADQGGGVPPAADHGAVGRSERLETAQTATNGAQQARRGHAMERSVAPRGAGKLPACR